MAQKNFTRFSLHIQFCYFTCSINRSFLLPLAKKLPESLISESESSLLFHKTSENFGVFDFGAKLLLLRLSRNSDTPLSCSKSDVLPAPRNDIFNNNHFALKKLTRNFGREISRLKMCGSNYLRLLSFRKLKSN